MYFCNIDFKLAQRKELFSVEKKYAPKCIIPINAQVIVLANKNKRLLEFINRQWPVFDGQVPLKKAKSLNMNFNRYEKLSGCEIVYNYCQFAVNEKKKIFFLGGEQESNQMAVEKIKSLYFGIEIEGFSPSFEKYPFSNDFLYSCFSKLELYKPEILFIGFGAPKQEYFIEDNYERLKTLGIKYIVSCGGTFDFISGKFKRAPQWVQNVGLEGMYRLFKQFNMMRIKRIMESVAFYRYVNKKPDFET